MNGSAPHEPGASRDIGPAATYLADLTNAIARIDVAALERFVVTVVEALTERRGIFVAGNGGSATAASHIASDWAAATNMLGGPVNVHCLSDNTARLTSLANDTSFEEVFSRQVEAMGRPGDLLVLLSVSGQSPNLVRAVKSARALDIGVLALVGYPGALANLCDTWIELGEGDYGLAEDLHIAVNHMVVRAMQGGVPQVYRPDEATPNRWAKRRDTDGKRGVS
ncbi:MULTISPECIES: D-sedoheptulose-7-phosphate isomerase [Nocardiopsidaceae]|uniref:SIS domain-containing protein n=1 Tax=Streptomonospora nanhaiensis TaxID=1323731 RepID=A0ABY6YQ02_9ACTN|nr:SIS domain-containing protein [Streptomonospora nanhaiensis]WAE74036.1 SIS domain-containing protein [Streptomonospora nanhaiensis]